MSIFTRAGLTAILLGVVFLPGAAARGSDEDANSFFLSELPIELHGFYELRSGYRLRKDKYEKDMSVMEMRFQLEASSYLDWADLKFKGDVVGDLVTEEAEFDLREAYLFTMPFDFIEVRLGRQILTWGTGDLVFINDMFPKDWQSFFIGRDVEYLKAPSDAVKVSVFGELANVDIVYTPEFDSDRFITGERISYWNSNLGRLAGRDAIISDDERERWFRDDEVAARVYKNINNYEFAFYGYRGFWKSPGGQNAAGTKAIFPELNVYGASVRGAVGKGIGNFEFGYYESGDDEGGTNGLVNNSEFRYLLGYTQEIGKDFTGGVQYYVEQMADYDEHKASTPVGLSRDEFRHVVTLRLTKLLMNQNLKVSLFTYFSPSDKDVYMRPNVHYKVSDSLGVEVGANIFFGDYAETFFGQFENNTNVYTAIRYSF